MGRAPRLHAKGCIYHVTLRGNHAAPIFDEPRNYEVLGEIVEDVLGSKGASAHAYCWMTNHLHLLLQVGDVSASTLMHDIGGRYSRYLQARRGTCGHLFDSRYFAELVSTDRYLIAAVCYVHLNPVRAAIVEVASDYPWSGHRAYLGGPRPAWLRTDLLLGFDDRPGLLSREMYLALTSSAEAREMDSPFPRRSRRRVSRNVRPVSSVKPKPDVSVLIADACARRSVSAIEIRKGAWRRDMVRLRVEIAAEILAEHHVSLRRMAAEFGCSHAALSRALGRHRGGGSEM